jgi:hypothetical protein
LIDAPIAIGVPEVTVPADHEELTPPPFGWAGGVSSVVPWTLTVHGGVDGAPVAKHVALSPMPATTTRPEVLGRRSAVNAGDGKVEMSVIRNRNRVIFAPVLFTKRRRIDSVPMVELFPGSTVRSRTRFATVEVALLASSGKAA